MENKENNAIPEIENNSIPAEEPVAEEFNKATGEADKEAVAEDSQSVATEDEPIEEASVEEARVEEKPAEVIDTESIRELAEETEAEWLTVAPIDEAPEIPIEKTGVGKRLKEYFGSIRWKRTWDKICLALLITLFAIPVLALIYVLTYFF